MSFFQRRSPRFNNILDVPPPPTGSDLNISVSDTTATSENTVLFLTSVNISVSDSSTTSENTIVRADANITVSDTTTTSELTIVAPPSSNVSVSDSTVTSESVPTPAVSYGVEVDLSTMNATTGAYFIAGVKVV